MKVNVFGQSEKVLQKHHTPPGGNQTSTISKSISGSVLTLTVHHGRDSSGNAITSQYSSDGANPITKVSTVEDKHYKSFNAVTHASSTIRAFQTTDPVMCLVSEKSFNYYSMTLTATPSNGGQAALSWTQPANAAITQYKVEYSTDGSTWTTSHGAVTGTAATVTGLSGGQQYSFRVSAINSS